MRLLSTVMLIPQNRLLAVVASSVLPLAVAAGLWTEPISTGAMIVAGVLLFLAAVDAGMGWRTAGQKLAFHFPEAVRLTKDRAGSVTVVIVNQQPGAPERRLRLGLGWPETVRTPTELLAIALTGGVERTRFEWACLPGRRGRHTLGRVHFEEASPLGWWAVRRSAATGCELRVYPDLRAERRQAAAIFLTRGGLGSHAQRQVGRGREFEKLRDYVAGDSIEDISWKATARRQRPVSKVFQVERTQEIYVLIDASRLSAQPAQDVAGPSSIEGNDEEEAATVRAMTTDAATGPTVLERYLSSALLLCQAAERQGDLFGLGTFADGMQHFLRARNGPAHFDACREAIYALEPAVVSPDFEELCAFLRLRLRRRALVVVLTSSLDDPVLAESFLRAVEGVSRQHVVLVNSLRPTGVAPLFTDADGGASIVTTGDVYRRLSGHLRWQKLRETEKKLRRLGVGFTLLDDARMTEQIVRQYLNVKQRQVL